MAYLRSIKRSCRCGATATEQLHNNRNAPMGCYCKRCAKRALREANDSEKRAIERERESHASSS